MSEPKTNRPTHRVYAVRGEGKSSYWTEIGAAWQHDDQDGMNLNLTMLPIGNDLRIVIRKPKTQEAA